jgi:hypothetical protein
MAPKLAQNIRDAGIFGGMCSTQIVFTTLVRDGYACHDYTTSPTNTRRSLLLAVLQATNS